MYSYQNTANGMSYLNEKTDPSASMTEGGGVFFIADQSCCVLVRRFLQKTDPTVSIMDEGENGVC